MLLNRPRAIQYLGDCGLDAIVSASPAGVAYLTDYYCWLDPLVKQFMMQPGLGSDPALQCFAVLAVDQSAALVVPAMLAVNAADTWVDDLYLIGSAGLDRELPPSHVGERVERLARLLREESAGDAAVDALVTCLRQKGLAEARIGLEMAGLPPAAIDDISAALPKAQIQDCTNLLRLIRMVKSEEEIRRLERSAEINERAAMESLYLARPGRPMRDLIEHYRRRIAEEGAEFDHFAFGYDGLGIAMEPDYAFGESTVMYVDFGCVWGHYYSDGGTTLALVEPSEPLRRRHEALRDCVAAGVQEIKPGQKSSIVRDAMWEVLSGRGVTDSFPHGHGLGLEIRDYPILVADNGLRICDDCIDLWSDLPLEENMVINLESAIFMPGVASLHIETSLVVTSEGSRALVPHDRTVPVLPTGGS